MKKHLALSSLLIFAFLATGCGPKAKSQSYADTPESHYRAGMRYLEDKEYNSAIQEFHPVNNEGRYPIGISLVDLPRELDKSFELGF